jgi:hypothetical protein
MARFKRVSVCELSAANKTPQQVLKSWSQVLNFLVIFLQKKFGK